jgi:hypothetical protein
MNRLLCMGAAVAFAFSTPVFAADAMASAPMTAQQTKMGDCNKQATGKKGDERKAFMKSCLSAGGATAAAAPMTQQEKMKKCNVDATGKKGDDRKAFMKACLSA